MNLTRREWHTMVAGGLVTAPLARARALHGAAQGKPNSTIAGVRIGTQSYSFRDRSLDEAITGMSTVGIGFCELWQGHIETDAAIGNPAQAARREALRKWRLTVPLDAFHAVRDKFNRAGVVLTAYNISFRDDFTDEEIARGFEMARALGVNVITASSNVATARRLDPFARRAKIRVGFHNHSRIEPNEFATPDDFQKALAGMSEWLAINLDIGHFTAANFDAVQFLDQHHERIVSLHIKDRKRDQGDNMPFGEGDTPIKAVLARLRDRRWDIPAQIEYEYKGADTVAEVRRSLEYCKQALAGGTVRDEAAPNTLTEAERKAGWRLLFDGKTTAGWRPFKKAAMGGGWQVVDGALTRVGEGGDIITTDQFDDFELALDWMVGEGGNSGVFFNATESVEPIYHAAPEMQILHNGGHRDGKVPETSAGSNYALHPPVKDVTRPVGSWNSARLIVRGNHVEHWLNGVKLLEYELGSADWQARVSKSKFKEWPPYGKQTRGHIGLQDHGDRVAFRNIKIRTNSR
jgi:sugar phosphate isomerase/epimerase